MTYSCILSVCNSLGFQIIYSFLSFLFTGLLSLQGLLSYSNFLHLPIVCTFVVFAYPSADTRVVSKLWLRQWLVLSTSYLLVAPNLPSITLLSSTYLSKSLFYIFSLAPIDHRPVQFSTHISIRIPAYFQNPSVGLEVPNSSTRSISSLQKRCLCYPDRCTKRPYWDSFLHVMSQILSSIFVFKVYPRQGSGSTLVYHLTCSPK